MASAYGNTNETISIVVDRTELELPVYYTSPNGMKYSLDTWQESDVNGLYEIFFDVIEEGQTYPQESINIDEFRHYFLSKYCFVIRSISSDSTDSNSIAGGFYIKSNFPGRSSHLANYGLLVNRKYRQQGLANFMVEQCIRLARQLKFKALYTNLVYVSNLASIKTCQRYGFQQVGRLPKAGNLKQLGYTDALQFYKDLEDQ
ncbi:hypothetical protein DERP_003613 [Dermatophagoides pteronyssinus]|uniref:N-acetyltransferase domain-containing protein n=1 Tax=Dermatophagoides pteronyssinus TaxID=6956 RepID=A0ABQ8JL42_DERPT|nr:hypothetical protein DERP_003613 [Dermatophagoides pteronyssinus]